MKDLTKDKLPVFMPNDQVIYQVTGGREGFFKTGAVQFANYNPDEDSWSYKVTVHATHEANTISEADIRYVVHNDRWVSRKPKGEFRVKLPEV